MKTPTTKNANRRNAKKQTILRSTILEKLRSEFAGQYIGNVNIDKKYHCICFNMADGRHLISDSILSRIMGFPINAAKIELIDG